MGWPRGIFSPSHSYEGQPILTSELTPFPLPFPLPILLKRIGESGDPNLLEGATFTWRRSDQTSSAASPSLSFPMMCTFSWSQLSFSAVSNCPRCYRCVSRSPFKLKADKWFQKLALTESLRWKMEAFLSYVLGLAQCMLCIHCPKPLLLTCFVWTRWHQWHSCWFYVLE